MNVFNEVLVPFNLQIFYFINHTIANGFFDFIMPRITDIGNDLPVQIFCLVIFLIGVMLRNKKIMILSVLAISSFFASSTIVNFLKVYFSQPRPFVTLSDVHLLVDLNNFHHDLYRSFPSGHSSNIFSFSTAVGLNYAVKIKGKRFKLAWILFPIAIIVAFSRPYIGVHYPLDILVGSTIGICVGLILTIVFKSVLKRFSIDF
ncbi:MAG: phosphatase PAP2 family protein [Methanobrevibacter sp.]|jgi:undecaprenyl-diphosphatase|nr:phosphatase PAP2 family protein [Candidatus Methanovirga aequatorialis]